MLANQLKRNGGFILDILKKAQLCDEVVLFVGRRRLENTANEFPV